MEFRFVIARLVVIIAGFIPSNHAYTIGWNYDGYGGGLAPDNWSSGYPGCGGSAQTPIDISTSTLTPTSGSLTFSGYNSAPSPTSYTVANVGQSLQINVNVNTITLTNSRLEGIYVLEQFHFHWGPTNSVGSEHTVNGQYYPLEIHFVHYNSAKYNSVSQAAGADDNSALLVLGVFVSVSENGASTTLASISDLMNQVLYPGNRTSIPPFALTNLLPSLRSCQGTMLYTYSGGLTSPGCVEVVNWNIFAQPIYISSSQLAKFRQIYSNTGQLMTTNYRPVQPLNGRTVYSYRLPLTRPCSSSSTPTAGAYNVLQYGHRFAFLFVAVLSAMFVSR